MAIFTVVIITIGSPYGGGGLSPNSDSSFAGEYGQVQDKKRWAQHQSVIEEAVTSQLRRYKAENRALRKQKRATLYILRLLEQKILDLREVTFKLNQLIRLQQVMKCIRMFIVY